MSADNGIYVAEFPTANGNVEYRVGYGSAIDNCELDFMPLGEKRTQLEDAYRAFWFRDSEVFTDHDKAVSHAYKLESEYENWELEYGVCSLKFDRPFNNLTQQEVQDIMAKY